MPTKASPAPCTAAIATIRFGGDWVRGTRATRVDVTMSTEQAAAAIGAMRFKGMAHHTAVGLSPASIPGHVIASSDPFPERFPDDAAPVSSCVAAALRRQ